MNSLSEAEVRKVSEQFSGVFKVRNKGLFMLGVSTGADIRELLTLTIGDVSQNDKLVDKLFFNNRDDVSRTVPVNQDGIKAIQSLIDWHVEHYGNIDVQRPLFPSRNGKGKVALTSKSGHAVLKKAFIAAGLNYKQKTHPSQKSTGLPTHEPAGHIFVAGIQGHININMMPMRICLNYEIEINHNRNKLLASRPDVSVKDLIIKLIRLVLRMGAVIRVDEWFPTLLEFTSELESVLEIILNIFF